MRFGKVYGVFIPNLPDAYWAKVKGVQKDLGLSVRQMFALGIRVICVMARENMAMLKEHVEIVKLEVSSRPGPKRRREVKDEQ